MTGTRVKDPALADRIGRHDLDWIEAFAPTARHFNDRLAARDFRGRRVAICQHVTSTFIPLARALRGSGAEVFVTACNRDSTDDAAAAHLAREGVAIRAWSGMTPAEYDANIAWLRAAGAEVVSDMGGDAISAYAEAGLPVQAAMEATTSGLHRLAGRQLAFPILDWNSVPLKEGLHNRYHVGHACWPVFTAITGLNLIGRTVLVIGFGPVGKGVAECARALGARVRVAEIDPTRRLEALHVGAEPVELAAGVAASQIVVTATGRDGIVGAAEFRAARPGTIFCNVGHSSDELDTGFLHAQPHNRVRPHIERIELGTGHVYLLNRGSLLNLAEGYGHVGDDLFEIYNALMAAGFEHMLSGAAARAGAGVVPFPKDVADAVADRAAEARAG